MGVEEAYDFEKLPPTYAQSLASSAAQATAASKANEAYLAKTC